MRSSWEAAVAARMRVVKEMTFEAGGQGMRVVPIN
jgi:hypothetical protein